MPGAMSISLHGKLIELLELKLLEHLLATVRTNARQQHRKFCLGQSCEQPWLGRNILLNCLPSMAVPLPGCCWGKSFGSSANTSGITNTFLPTAPCSLGAPPAKAFYTL
jgi:hypothetical protein